MFKKALIIWIALFLVLISDMQVNASTWIEEQPGISWSDPVTMSGNGGCGKEALLQFTSNGHVLGFGKDHVIVASSDHMVQIEFLGPRAVSPETEGMGSGGEKAGMASPFGRVTYRNVWDGVTVVYEPSRESILKSTYHVRADGESTYNIRLRYNRPVSVDKKGNLVISYDRGAIVEEAPVAWQEIGGARRVVKAAYALYGEQEVGFAVSDWLPNIPLVIDPAMTWNTFLGASGSDNGRAIAVDGSGNVYVAGSSNMETWGSPVRPYTPFGSDAFVAKLASDGSLIWNTFLGASGDDGGGAIAVDGSGNVYIAGYSSGTWGSPVRAYSSSSDAFVAKLGSDGSLVWNTFLGQSYADSGRAVTVDLSGNVYVAGYSMATWGSPVRPYTSWEDAFVAKLGSDGSLIWNTFLGGTWHNYGNAITVDGSGNVYVAGDSSSTWGSPVRPYSSYHDAFVAKLGGDGSLTWNTFLGGSGMDYSKAIALDGSGNIYVVGGSGNTWGSPVRPFSPDEYGVKPDAFAAKLGNNGSLIWNTFLGGSGGPADYSDYGEAIALDGSGNIYVAGYSVATWGSPIRPYSSGEAGDEFDAFVAKLGSDGSLTWNLFLGGSSYDYGNAIAVDGSCNVYVAGSSFSTWGSPVRPYSSYHDAFVAKLPETPTLIELASFRSSHSDVEIILTWETASEMDTAGFHIWRRDAQGGEYRRITAALIPATGSSSSGANYSYEDHDIVAGRSYVYMLEEVDTSGTSTLYLEDTGGACILKGDVNGDGKVDMGDVLYLLQVLSGGR